MIKINDKLKIILLFLITLIITGFTFCLTANAEMIDSSFSVSYVSPTTTSKFNDMIILGNSYSGARIGFNQTLDYYVIDYSYRMSTPGRKYNVYFMVISTSGSMPVFTLNNQACEVFVATENDLATVGGGVINGQVFNVACVNIDPDPNNFQIVVRHNIKNINNGYLYYYGVKKGFFVSSYPSEEQALNNAMSDLATAINNNQTNNTNRIINSVENFGNQLNQQQQQTNQKLEDINNTLTDSSVDNFGVSYNQNYGPISSLITMPITLARGYLTGLNSSCSPYNLGSLYGTNLILPCVNISSFLGSSLYGVIDILFSGFMIFAIAKMFIRTFNKMTNLDNEKIEGELFND